MKGTDLALPRSAPLNRTSVAADLTVEAALCGELYRLQLQLAPQSMGYLQRSSRSPARPLAIVSTKTIAAIALISGDRPENSRP